jgi:protein TonB
LKKFFVARRFSWPLTFSIFLHVSLIGGLVYASIQDQIEIPAEADAAPMNVMMVDPAVFATPADVAEQNSSAKEVQSEPESEPEVAKPDPIPEPVEIEKPKPIPVEKPKPKKEVKKEVKKEPKKEPRKEIVNPANIDAPATTTAASPQIAPVVIGSKSAVQGISPSTGSKVLRQVEPAYPKQAFDRRIEGRVEIMFDIDDEGRVENVRFIYANPPRMFERDVRVALKKWRYTPVVVKDKKMTIVFKIDGGAKIS